MFEQEHTEVGQKEDLKAWRGGITDNRHQTAVSDPFSLTEAPKHRQRSCTEAGPNR